MLQNVREVMASNPVCLPASASVTAAAVAMRDAGIGDVLVEDDGRLRGVVTDRDIVVRVAAGDADPSGVSLEEICSQALAVVAADDPADKAVQLMKTKAVRRLPVVDGGQLVGTVSLGDLAVTTDSGSALAAISSAPANR